MSKTKYFYMYIILLFKSYLFWPNDPEQNQYCFKYYYPKENEEGEILNFDSCKKKGGNYKHADFCCNINCGINGTVIGPHCKWVVDKSICKFTSNLYYSDQISIIGSRYTSRTDLLYPIYNLFNFYLPKNYGWAFCTFKSKEDLLINFANQINGKFIYSLGGGHNYFDKRLMDTSGGRGFIESPFLIYPTYGILGVSGGESYDDRNVLGYDCSGLSMALIYLTSGYNFDRENTNAQKMYDIAKKNNLLKKDIKIGYALFYGKSENSISHVTIALGENKMIEASGHNLGKTGKPIQIVKIRNNMIGIADFISDNEQESSRNSKSNQASSVLFNSIHLSYILLYIFLLI